MSKPLYTQERTGKQRFHPVLILLVIAIVFISLEVSTENSRIKNEKRLLNGIETIAVIQSLPFSRKGRGTFEYIANGQHFYGRFRFNYLDLNVGDTIIIKYAKDDPETYQITDLWYMKKQEIGRKFNRGR